MDDKTLKRREGEEEMDDKTLERRGEEEMDDKTLKRREGWEMRNLLRRCI